MEAIQNVFCTSSDSEVSLDQPHDHFEVIWGAEFTEFGPLVNLFILFGQTGQFVKEIVDLSERKLIF